MIALSEEKKAGYIVIKKFTLTNSNGMQVEILNYGARIHKLNVRSKSGFINVVAGFDGIEEYLGDNPYFNATIGRVANRIGGAQFRLNGKTYNLCKNNGNNTLHGGKYGFDRKIWNSETVNEKGVEKLIFTSVSPDGEEGFPGNMKAEVRYSLSNDDALNIEYKAVSDADTLCNLTNHAYFNLSGDFNRKITDTYLKINAGYVTPTDAELIPTGELGDLKQYYAYDFNAFKKIGCDIEKTQGNTGGYDINYVLHNGCSEAAVAYEESSGVRMTVFTDRPCLQFYSGNMLGGLKGRFVYKNHSAFCLETQGYPNACNIKEFGSTLLKKGEIFKSKTAYKFELQQ